jgi:uncharacterized protein (UPF0335 family)
MGLPFKEDEDFSQHNSAALTTSAEEVRQFVQRMQALGAEVEDIRREQKDEMTLMKSRGYNTKVLRQLLARLKRDAGEVAEEQETLQLYMDLLRD